MFECASVQVLRCGLSRGARRRRRRAPTNDPNYRRKSMPRTEAQNRRFVGAPILPMIQNVAGLPGCVRPMRPARIAPVDRVEQIAELRRRDRDGAVRRARPDEPARFETLGVKRQADAVVRQRTLIMSPRRPRKTKRSPACGYVARHISSHMCRAWICVGVIQEPMIPRRSRTLPTHNI